jgi:hypothetical protein
MEHPVDLHRRDSRTLQGGKEYAAQRIAKRRAKPAFERFGNQGSYAAAILSRLNFELVGADEFLPILLINLHAFIP